jgi:hypothetical protein
MCTLSIFPTLPCGIISRNLSLQNQTVQHNQHNKRQGSIICKHLTQPHSNVRSGIKVDFNCLQPSDHYMYHQFNIQQLYVLPTVYLCVLYGPENKPIISLYSINWLVFITETECVYCAVRSTRYVLPTQCICVFCVDLRTNSDYFTLQH